VHQTLDAVFDLDEGTVVGNIGDLAEDTGVLRVTTGDVDPGIVAHLLQAQGNAHLFAVELEHLDVDLVTDLDHLGRMLDALPGHVGDVQQAVDAAQVDERTVFGEVLDDTLDDLAFLQGFQQLLALFAVLFLDDGATGNHNVVALLVQLDDLELQVLAFQVRGVADRTDVDQGARQECADLVHLDGETALDLAADTAGNDLFCFESFLEFLPGVVALGLFAGQAGQAPAVFNRVQRDFHLVTDGHFQVAIVIHELVLGDNAFGLESGIDDHRLVVDADNSADYDGTGLEVGVGDALFKELSKAFGHWLNVPTHHVLRATH
jgi:hypothetical protein